MLASLRAHLRRLWRPIRLSRTGLFAFALLNVLTVVLCFLPGVNVLNYYSSLVLAVVGGVLGGLTGISVARAALASGHRPFVEAARASVCLAAVPPLLLLLNGFRVTNCDPLEGLAFYVVGAGLTIAFSAQVGAFVTHVSRRWRWALPLFGLIWLAWIARDLLHLYENPAIFAYNPFVGFFSGAVYDTVINIDARLVLYRLNNLAQLAVLWSLVWLGWRAGRASRDAFAEAPSRRWAVLAVAVVASAAFYGLRGEIGYEVDRDDVIAALGGQVDNDRLTLIYDARAINESDARRLLEDHTYRLDQLERALGTPYPHRITSYVYGSADQKRRLMGAGSVYIAKPWLREIHLNHVSYGHTVILHELAHVVLGQFAPPLLEVPTAMCVPNMAMVEGAAEAFEWDTGALTPHQWSAAMREAKIAPSLATLLGPDGFYLQSSGKAYTVSGSFIRWLIDTRGPAAFRDAYRDADFERAYAEALPEILAGWEAFIDTVVLPPDAAALAKARFVRKAVFLRTCPLEVARLEVEAGRKRGAGDRAGALAVYEKIAGYVDGDPAKLIPILRLHAEAGDVPAAERAHARYLAMKGRNAVQDAEAVELLADARWRSGDAAGAAAGYLTLTAVPQSDDRRRNVLAKALVSQDQELEPILGPYLLNGGGADGVEYILEAAADLPDHPLAVYLAGRRLSLGGRHAEGIRALKRALSLLDAQEVAAPWAALVRREAWRLLGHSALWEGQLSEARAAFALFVAQTPWDGEKDRYRDWMARMDWLMERRP